MIGRLKLIAVFGILGIERNKFRLAASLKAACTIYLLREVILDRREQKRSEFPFKRIDLSQGLVIKQVQKEALG